VPPSASGFQRWTRICIGCLVLMAGLCGQVRAESSYSPTLTWTYTAWGTFWDAALVELPEPLVALASFDRMVYAIGIDGRLRWRRYLTAPAYQVEAVRWHAGRLGVAAGDEAGRVTLLDQRGQVLWWRSLGSRVTVLRALDLDGDGLDELLAGGWDERLSCLDAAGQLRWQVELGAAATALDAFDAGGRVWVGTAAGTYLQIDAGGVVAHRAFDAPVMALDASAGLVSLQNGRLVAGAWDARLGRGALAWGTTGDLLAVGATSGELVLLHPDGDLQWQVSMPAPVNAIHFQDLDGDGTPELVAGSDAGSVYVLDLDGQVLGEVDVHRPVWALEPLPDGAVLVRAGGLAARLAWVPGDSPPTPVEPWGTPPRLRPLAAGPPLRSARQHPDEAVLLFLGDVMLGRTAEAYVSRHGPAFLWEGLAPVLDAADLVVVNLENPLTVQGSPLDKPFILRAHRDTGAALGAAGVDVASLANNHALDFGAAGLEETLEAVERRGIVTVGAGSSRAAAEEPAIVMAGGLRVAVLAYAAPRWRGSEDMPASDLVAWASPDRVQAGVRAVREAVDLVVVLIHAGREYDPRPTADLRAAAQAALNAGADLVVGHHTHVVGQVELHSGGRVVAYSLGNAVFDMGPIEIAHHGAALRVQVGRHGVSQVELWPFWIDGVRPRLLLGAGWQPKVEALWPARSRFNLD
jgi:poly-gamma-glutamate synthesis protein (capsule biosynthesis protein)